MDVFDNLMRKLWGCAIIATIIIAAAVVVLGIIGFIMALRHIWL